MSLNIYECINALHLQMLQCSWGKTSDKEFHMTERSFSCCYFRCFCVLLTSVKSVSNTREGGRAGVPGGKIENVQHFREKVNVWNVQFVENLLSP